MSAMQRLIMARKQSKSVRCHPPRPNEPPDGAPAETPCWDAAPCRMSPQQRPCKQPFAQQLQEHHVPVRCAGRRSPPGWPCSAPSEQPPHSTAACSRSAWRYACEWSVVHSNSLSPVDDKEGTRHGSRTRCLTRDRPASPPVLAFVNHKTRTVLWWTKQACSNSLASLALSLSLSSHTHALSLSLSLRPCPWLSFSLRYPHTKARSPSYKIT